MIQTFTPNDLVRYLYKEVTQKETIHIARALIDDSELQQQYSDMVYVTEQLDSIRVEPSASCINNILNYAKGTVQSRSSN